MKNYTNFKTGWFIISKHAMDRQDYRILAGSIDDPEPWRIRFKNWIKDDIPLEASAASPGAPYYYFIPEVIDGILNQIIIRQTWADYGDFGSRRVLNTTCLILPYDVYRKHPCGFKQQADLFELPEVQESLSNALLTIRNGETLFSQPSPEITLPSSSEVEEYYLAQLSEHGLDFSQAIGTYLTKGKNVCILEHNDKITDLEQRLEWLDTALIALPYGVRANCSASSWQSTYAETGDRLVVGRKSNPNLAYLPVDEEVERINLCEGYSAGIMRMLESGHSAEELVRTFLTRTEPVRLQVLRYGPQAILRLSPQEQVVQLLVNPEEYDSEANQRALIEKIKKIDLNKVNVKDLQTLLVRTVPVLEDTDATLIKEYWSDALLTQAIANFKSGNNKILHLLPLIIPDDLSEEKLLHTLDEIWDHSTTKEANSLDELTRFFESLHRFCNNRAQADSLQLALTITAVLNKIAKSGSVGHIAALIWIRFVLSPGTNYQNTFFEALRQQKILYEPLSIFSTYWDQQKLSQIQIDSSSLGNILLPLTKILLIRNINQQDAEILLGKMVNLLTPANSQLSNGNLSKLRKPYIRSSYWEDHPQDGNVAALLDMISFIENKSWNPISTINVGGENSIIYRRKLSELLNYPAIKSKVNEVDSKAIYVTLSSLDQGQPPRESQETQINAQDKASTGGSLNSSDLLPENEHELSPVPTETENQEMEQPLSEETQTSSALTASNANNNDKNLAENGIENVGQQSNNTDPSITEMPSDINLHEAIQIDQVLLNLAQSIAKQIEEGRSHGDNTIWTKITSEIPDKCPSFSSQELEQFLLLTLGSIQDGNIRKETLNFFLPVLYKNYPTLDNPTNQTQFFQSHSEFVADVLRSYHETFQDNPKFSEWTDHLSGLL